MSGLAQVFDELETPPPPTRGRKTKPPRWATAAGFADQIAAETAGCYEHNCGQFRNGKPMPEQPARFVIRDAGDLLMTAPTPVNYVIDQWLPEGLTLLVASPKLGKTTLAMQIILALVTGSTFWGQDVTRGKALMIDLETNERRLRRKLEQAGVATLDQGLLYYATDWPKGILGVERIAITLDEDPAIKLVVIDTLQRFRDSGTGKQNAYAADYDALAPLQQLCRDRAGLSIICIHHKRKAATDDPVDSINGSAAIAGAADSIWIMSRKGSEYTLHIQARDWERDEDTFSIERDAGRWRLVDGPRYSQNEAEVLKHLEIAGGMTSTELGEALKISRQSAHERLTRMKDRGFVRYSESAWHICT
jgi:hypothetical protein